MAKALAEAGVRAIALLDSNNSLGKLAAKQLSDETGADCDFHRVDVTDGAAVSRSIADIHTKHGQIDILISSAGIAE